MSHPRLILTKYCGPTDTKGARIRVGYADTPARCGSYLPYDHAADDAHRAAVDSFLWGTGKVVTAEVAVIGGRGYVVAFI